MHATMQQRQHEDNPYLKTPSKSTPSLVPISLCVYNYIHTNMHISYAYCPYMHFVEQAPEMASISSASRIDHRCLQVCYARQGATPCRN
jgi:hypothetical protein